MTGGIIRILLPIRVLIHLSKEHLIMMIGDPVMTVTLRTTGIMIVGTVMTGTADIPIGTVIGKFLLRSY